MQEPKSGTAEAVPRPKGVRALVGAAIAIVGAILAALSEPPEMARRK